MVGPSLDAIATADDDSTIGQPSTNGTTTIAILNATRARMSPRHRLVARNQSLGPPTTGAALRPGLFYTRHATVIVVVVDYNNHHHYNVGLSGPAFHIR